MNQNPTNQCRICGQAFPPKHSNPTGTLCYDPECRNERRRQTSNTQRAGRRTVPPAAGQAMGVQGGVCACGAPTARIYSCEECFAQMTWAATQGIVEAHRRLGGGRDAARDERGAWLLARAGA